MPGNITGNSPKLDNQTTLGLLGVHDSLAYRAAEIEKHLHGREKWFGLAAAPAAETHRADPMDGAIAPFEAVAGNNDWGSWLQIIGSSDTPVMAGNKYYDAHRILVTNTNSTLPFIFQVVGGESATLAAAVAAGIFTSVPYIGATNNNDSGIEDIMSSRVPAGTKVWVRCACVGGNATTIDFYFGIHEYEG